jgi:exosome complex component RRP43
LLLDPTAFEEPLLDTTISVILDEKKGLLSYSQTGPGELQNSEEDLQDTCIQLALAHHERLIAIANTG